MLNRRSFLTSGAAALGAFSYLKISDAALSSHIVMEGDTGVGKSSAIRNLLYYARQCGDICLVLDSKQEFLPEFYHPEWGDKILSPKDDRTVWWDLGGEVTDEVDAMAVMRAFYPPKPNHPQAEWFQDQAAKIGAYLITYPNPRPSCEEFGYWLAHDHIILEKLKDSEHARSLNANAAEQKSGILGTMNQAGFAFRIMPPDSDRAKRTRFTIREWARTRDGWLFLPSSAETRDALGLLQSGWVSMAILRIMSMRQRVWPLPKRRRVWIVLDEVDTLGAISKLSEAMSMMRSTGNPMILGMQNIAQLDDRYAKQAKTIFSQPPTKFVFAVSEPESAKHAQELFGEKELQYARQSRTTSIVGLNERDTHSGPEEIRKPAVLASEVQGLPNLCAVVSQRPIERDAKPGLRITRIRMKYRAPVLRCPAEVTRIIPPMEKRPHLSEPEKPESNEVVPPPWILGAMPAGTAKPSGDSPPFNVVSINAGALLNPTGAKRRTDPYYIALVKNARRIHESLEHSGAKLEEFEGPPITRFICTTCKTITTFDGVLKIPPGICPACGGEFYFDETGEYAKNTVMKPHRKRQDKPPEPS